VEADMATFYVTKMGFYLFEEAIEDMDRQDIPDKYITEKLRMFCLQSLDHIKSMAYDKSYGPACEKASNYMSEFDMPNVMATFTAGEECFIDEKGRHLTNSEDLDVKSEEMNNLTWENQEYDDALENLPYVLPQVSRKSVKDFLGVYRDILDSVPSTKYRTVDSRQKWFINESVVKALQRLVLQGGIDKVVKESDVGKSTIYKIIADKNRNSFLLKRTVLSLKEYFLKYTKMDLDDTMPKQLFARERMDHSLVNFSTGTQRRLIIEQSEYLQKLQEEEPEDFIKFSLRDMVYASWLDKHSKEIKAREARLDLELADEFDRRQGGQRIEKDTIPILQFETFRKYPEKIKAENEPRAHLPTVPKPSNLRERDAFGVLIQNDDFIPLVGPGKLLICTYKIDPTKGDLVIVRFPARSVQIGTVSAVVEDADTGEKHTNVSFIQKSTEDEANPEDVPFKFSSHQFDPGWALTAIDGNICEEPLIVAQSIAVVHTVRDYDF
tara:strand:+ start:3263 stop:4747 length:1485 start_codon:yes stop_codon:yes gene_type:complete